MVERERERCEIIAKYMLDNNATVRAAAAQFNISKSTVHKDVTAILERENYALWLLVRDLLERNKAERHVRGGEATKMKYKLKRDLKNG